MSEQSLAGFRFGLFCSTARDASALSERALSERSVRPHWQPDSSYLFDVGMVLEERALLAQGAISGVFPKDEVAHWLTDDDPRLPMFRELAADREDRLPPFLTSDELLAQVENSRGAGRFRSTLFFRDDERAFELERYHSTLVFGTDDDWSELIDRAAAEAERIFSDIRLPELKVLTDIFDSVMVCANLLSYLGGEPQGSLSPWHVALPGLDSDARRIDLTALAAARAQAATKTVRSAFASFGMNLFEDAPSGDPLRPLINVLILKYVLIALMPITAWMEIVTAEAATGDVASSLEVFSALEMFSGVVIGGPEMSWGAAAWRQAPSDSRSLSRQREAVDLLLVTLRRLQDEGFQGERTKPQFV
jgi:hypothetical protein